MHVTLVHVCVKAGNVRDFVEATTRNHEASIREPGNLRFDVLQSAEDETRFVLVEVFRSADAAAAHKKTAHYLRWRDAVADWMATPREGKPFRVIAPVAESSW